MGAQPPPSLVEILEKDQGRRFARARHGSDREQVDAFLGAIASRTEALETELDRSRATPEIPSGGEDLVVRPPPAKEPSESSTERIERLAAVMEREIERMPEDAKVQAATTMSEARREADRIKSDAQDAARLSIDEVRSFLTQAERDAEEMRSGVVERRRQMTEELLKMQELLERVAQALEPMLETVGPEPDPGSHGGSPPSVELDRPSEPRSRSEV
jgi:cell division septum initiation protein DivIVA